MKLALLGGKDGPTAVRKILHHMISHTLALQLNWAGRNAKKGLKENVNILKLIIASVRRNPNSKNTTIEEVETTIKSWLRNATDRAGGRGQRKKANQE